MGTNYDPGGREGDERVGDRRREGGGGFRYLGDGEMEGRHILERGRIWVGRDVVCVCLYNQGKGT